MVMITILDNDQQFHLQPLFHIIERLLISDVVDNNDTVGASVIAGGDGSEPLLASSVPNLI